MLALRQTHHTIKRAQSASLSRAKAFVSSSPRTNMANRANLGAGMTKASSLVMTSSAGAATHFSPMRAASTAAHSIHVPMPSMRTSPAGVQTKYLRAAQNHVFNNNNNNAPLKKQSIFSKNQSLLSFARPMSSQAPQARVANELPRKNQSFPLRTPAAKTNAFSRRDHRGRSMISTPIRFCHHFIEDATKIRNVAVIAHVDHGKTTLVDKLLRDSGTVTDLGDERVMDSNSLEKERGITIMAKQTSISWKNHKLNLVDTPGHGDFGGEVERILSMVDGVILLVDCQEGPMTQTKFVLGKALARGLKPIVVLNKMDRAIISRVNEVENDLFDLFANLEANDHQMEYPTLYASAKAGWVITEKEGDSKNANTSSLLDAIIEHVPPPKIEDKKGFSMLVTNMESDSFLGRMLSGRVYSGNVQIGNQLHALDQEGKVIDTCKVTKVIHRIGMTKIEAPVGIAGDIVTVAGFEKAGVTSTLATTDITTPIPTIAIDPPVLRMTFGVNKSPLAGREGTYHTLPQIRKRLEKELENNVSLKVEESETGPEAMDVSGRGELQLGILIENMRREGFELSIYPPTVVLKEEKGQKMEPLEEVFLDVDEDYQNDIILSMTERKGEMIGMRPIGQGKIRLSFEVPARGLIGFRTQLMAMTKGTGVLNHAFLRYIPYQGAMDAYRRGHLISMATGTTTSYALRDLEKRGTMFVGPGINVYEGMIIGECQKEGDLHVNPTKAKHTSNVRAAGKDEAIRLTPPKKYSLEEALSMLSQDQLLEVTPQNIRFRKLPKEETRGKRKN